MKITIAEGEIGLDLETPTYTLDPDGFEAAVVALAPKACPGASIQVHTFEGRVEAYRYFHVVETVTDEDTQLTVDQAYLLDDEAEIGEEIGLGQALDAFVELGLLDAPTWVTPKS